MADRSTYLGRVVKFRNRALRQDWKTPAHASSTPYGRQSSESLVSSSTGASSGGSGDHRGMRNYGGGTLKPYGTSPTAQKTPGLISPNLPSQGTVPSALFEMPTEHVGVALFSPIIEHPIQPATGIEIIAIKLEPLWEKGDSERARPMVNKYTSYSDR